MAAAGSTPDVRSLLVLGMLLAAVAPAAAKPIRKLPTSEHHFVVRDPAIQGDYVTIDYFRVTAASPTLTAEINTAIAYDAQMIGVLGDHQVTGDSALSGELSCSPGILTDSFVAWVCRGIWLAVERNGGGPGTSGNMRGQAYFVDKGALVPATLDKILLPGTNLADLPREDGSRCAPEPKQTDAYVTAEGIEISDGYEPHGCLWTWEQLDKVLSPAFRAATPGEEDEVDDDYDPKRLWAKAPPRFVVEGEAVRDHVTDLLWAMRDNGADVTWQAADAWARAYRGDGKSDWRLPTEDELAVLAEPLMGHREKGDCTKGKSSLTITPLIHLSCGLAWSSTQLTKRRAVAFGFISGTARAARLTDKKNLRALVVRDARPPAAASAKK